MSGLWKEQLNMNDRKGKYHRNVLLYKLVFYIPLGPGDGLLVEVFHFHFFLGERIDQDHSLLSARAGHERSIPDQNNDHIRMSV
jgi:hypothetical protein